VFFPVYPPPGPLFPGVLTSLFVRHASARSSPCLYVKVRSLSFLPLDKDLQRSLFNCVYRAVRVNVSAAHA